VTGFLGSGKTTFLREASEQHRDQRIVYLVNEFAEADVDGELLADLPGNAVSISGGSIFCRCKATDFIDALRRIVTDLPTSDGIPVEGVVIEATGIANPMVIERLIRETGLDEHYRITSIICIVDPGTFGKLIQTLPPIHAQVQAADVVILNKCDLHDETELAVTEAEIASIRADAKIVRAQFGRALLDLFGGHVERGLEGETAPCRDPRFVGFSVALDEEVDWPMLAEAIERVRDDLYRVKGFVRSQGQSLYVDFAGGELSAEPSKTAPGRPMLVFIARGEQAHRVEQLVREIENRRYYRERVRP
jgi:G3E family GTPase